MATAIDVLNSLPIVITQQIPFQSGTRWQYTELFHPYRSLKPLLSSLPINHVPNSTKVLRLPVLVL